MKDQDERQRDQRGGFMEEPRQEMMVYEEVQWQARGEVLGWKKVSK